MDIQQLEAALIESLRAYWRIKAGSAALRYDLPNHPLFSHVIEYSGIPSCNASSPLLGAEKLNTVFNEVAQYISSGQFSTTFFLRFVSHIESYFSAKLLAKGCSADGTLGSLQTRCQQAYNIGVAHKQKMDEIRERRNSIVHHHGSVTQKYINAANFVHLNSSGAVPDPNSIQTIFITDQYLAYCVDSLIDYAKQF